MHKFFALFVVIIIAFGMFMPEANAKRFGGGRSFGMQRSMSSFSNPNKMQAAPLRNQTNRWTEPLIGALAGGLLASLFMGHGLGTGMLAWLVIGIAALFLVRFLRAQARPSYQSASNYNLYRMNQSSQHGFSQAANHHSVSPIGFDESDFLREAKALFLRLQAANDNKNLTDLHEFTTPQVFAEIQLQLQERGEQNNLTIVDSLNAELSEATEHPPMNVSVRFTWSTREEGISSSLNEIWHFHKDRGQWLVSGVQS